MRQLRASDRAMLVALVSLWAMCAALHLKAVHSGRLAWVSVYVSPPTDRHAFPTVRGFWPGVDAATVGLAIGDQLVRAGDVDLRGVGPFGFVARAYEEADAHRRVPLTYVRQGTAGHAAMPLIPVAFPWRLLPLTLTLVVTGTLVLVRRPDTRVARAFFVAAIAFGLHWTFFFGGPRLQTYAWTIVFFGASLVVLPLILRAMLIFPPEVAPAGGRVPRWPWLFAVFGPISTSWVFGEPLPPEIGFRAVFLVNVAFIATALTLLTRNYLRASPVGRRQLKWVVYGMYVGTVPLLLTNIVTTVRPDLWWLHEIAAMAESFIPICVLIAIVRFNFFDIDRLITTTAVYSCLTVVLVAVGLTVIPRLGSALSIAAGVDARTGELALSVLAAVAVVPAQRYLRPRLERRLFRERHALKRGVDAFRREISASAGPQALLTFVGERLDALVRPYSCVIFAPADDAYEPVFARGEGHAADDPPALPAHGYLIDALRVRTTPLDLEEWAPRRVDETVPPEERRVLERLRAAVLLPVRRGDTLAAVACLGRKRSGDVYTATDLALLATISDKASTELLRFDAAEILRQERAMVAAFRRYVPEPVAARLSRGQAIEGGERTVSVLFVDLRGYTTYSERQAAGDVFSVVNRYATAISTVIQQHGGTVVEFLGDGLMAVFGAPEPLPDHARVAVEAAHDIVTSVPTLATDATPALAVGVGIATGEAFVGNIQTSDRLVYTAVGDVVNLASRIQGLTRELHAAVAVDAATYAAAGAAGAGFRRHAGVPIRGRQEGVDVYALPLQTIPV